MTNKPESKVTCPKCKRKDIRYRVDKTFRCLKCGYDSRSDIL